MKIKILYIIDGIIFGGGERAFAQIIKGIDKEKYEVYCACFAKGAFAEKIKNYVGIFPMDLSNRYNLSNIYGLVKIMKEKNIQIVHTQGGRGDFFGRVAAGLARTPVIISTVATPVEGYDVNPIKRLIYIWLDRISERFVHKFIVVSDTLIKRLVRIHRISPKKIIKIYNGIELEEYTCNTDSGLPVRKEFNLGTDIILLGAIGRLTWVKGLTYLIRAVRNIEEREREIADKIRCLIVGEGKLRKDLENLARTLNIERKIIFTGFRNDIKEILSSLDIFVLPSILEGQPIVLLEAMAMAKPVVVSNIQGVDETIVNGVSGVSVPSGNHVALSQAITSLLKDRVKAQTMGQEARKVIEERFKLQDKIIQHEKLYQQMFLDKIGVS